MVVTDVARAVLVAVMAVPGMPLPALAVLLVAVQMLAAPFLAARSAILPHLLDGDRYVAGAALMGTTYQSAQVLGFALGGPLVAAIGVSPALGVDAATLRGVGGGAAPRSARAAGRGHGHDDGYGFRSAGLDGGRARGRRPDRGRRPGRRPGRPVAVADRARVRVGLRGHGRGAGGALRGRARRRDGGGRGAARREPARGRGGDRRPHPARPACRAAAPAGAAGGGLVRAADRLRARPAAGRARGSLGALRAVLRLPGPRQRRVRRRRPRRPPGAGLRARRDGAAGHPGPRGPGVRGGRPADVAARGRWRSAGCSAWSPRSRPPARGAAPAGHQVPEAGRDASPGTTTGTSDAA